MKPHKHAELIKAWADGAEIEYSDSSHGDWVLTKHPEWSEGLQYRIKPELKPDYCRYIVGDRESNNWYEFSVLQQFRDFETLQPQIRITFDGETGELKSAEVLK